MQNIVLDEKLLDNIILYANFNVFLPTATPDKCMELAELCQNKTIDGKKKILSYITGLTFEDAYEKYYKINAKYI